MHLLLIHQAFTSPAEAGGTRHYEFARHLVARGHAVTIVASDLAYLSGTKKTGGTGSTIAEQDLDGIRVLRAYTYPSLHKSWTGRVVSFLSFMTTSFFAAWKAGPPDLVMGTSPPVLQTVSSWLTAFLRRKPFLLEVRDLWLEFAVDAGIVQNRLLIALAGGLERFLYRRAKRIVVNSPAYRDAIIAKGTPPGKVLLIPNGVDPSMFDPGDRAPSVRKELGLEGKFVATYAGALGVTNDIPTILRAARQLQDDPAFHFLLVGDGRERTRLEALSSELGLRNVTFTGTRSKAQMASILAASDACLATLRDMPVMRTTYPNKVFDYMAAGRPTVLAIGGVIRDVVEASGGGLCVEPGDDAGVADALRRLRADPAGAQAMGAAARAHVCEHFNRAGHASAFLALAEGMVGR